MYITHVTTCTHYTVYHCYLLVVVVGAVVVVDCCLQLSVSPCGHEAHLVYTWDMCVDAGTTSGGSWCGICDCRAASCIVGTCLRDI